MGYCYDCGKALRLGIPARDDRIREICMACGYVHYVNPRILVSCIVHSAEKLLWIKRGHDPRAHFWAMPTGFLEQNESLQQAAVRELREETGLVIATEDLTLCVLSSLTFINEVYVVFHVCHEEVVLSPPSDEVLDIRFLNENDVPWNDLAFPDTENYMREFYRELRTGVFSVYIGEFTRSHRDLLKIGADT